MHQIIRKHHSNRKKRLKKEGLLPCIDQEDTHYQEGIFAGDNTSQNKLT